jgi:tetratricopeptide (TPR) repeat protein
MAWAAWDLIAESRVPRRVLAAATAAIIIVVCATAARHQVGYWSSNVLLWQHAREVSAGSLVEANLGDAYATDGKLNEAVTHLSEALRMRPNMPELHYKLGAVLERQGWLPGAMSHYRDALRMRPTYAEAHSGLGSAFVKQGMIGPAIVQFSEALRLKPDARGHFTVAELLRKEGRSAEADEHLRAALRLNPDFAPARIALEGIASIPRRAAGADRR